MIIGNNNADDCEKNKLVLSNIASNIANRLIDQGFTGVCTETTTITMYNELVDDDKVKCRLINMANDIYSLNKMNDLLDNKEVQVYLTSLINGYIYRQSSLI